MFISIPEIGLFLDKKNMVETLWLKALEKLVQDPI